MPAITIESPAKLNLHLKVGDRRPDGFHDIESLFVALAFGDTLHFETTPSETTILPEINMNWQVVGLSGGQFGGLAPVIPPEKNIITRAISLFRDRTSYNQGLKVTVEKRIPPGGGLGGGSSNAAATLLALNLLAADGKPLLGDAELAEMGALLGSDVPFFLYRNPAAWVTGRGEQIQPLELPESAMNLPLVLVNPGFSSDTAEAYRLLDCVREETHTKAQRHEGGEEIWERWIESLASCQNAQIANNSPQSPVPGLQSLLFNDFLTVLADSEKGLAYQRIIDELRELGADFAGLSGSGATCFGVFPGRNQAEIARKVLLERKLFNIITFLLARWAIPYYNSK